VWETLAGPCRPRRDTDGGCPWTGTTPADPARSESFDDFVVARSDQLLRTAYLLTRDRALAEDLLQTAQAKAWSSWGRIQSRPEPYVRQILVNTYATWWRRRWNGERATAELPEPGAGDRTHAVDDRSDLWVALGALPRRQRAVVVLRFFEDLTEAETARLFGCTVGTVKSQTHKALARAAAGRGPRQRPHRPTSTRKGTGMNVDDLGTELRARSDETTGHHRSARLAEVRGRIAARRRARAGGAAVLVAVAVAAGRAGATADQRGAGDDRHRSGASGYGSGRPAGSRPAGVPPAIDGNPLAFSYLAPRGVDVFEQRVRLDVLDVTYQQLCRADDADGLRGAFTFANLSINGDSLYGSRAARATPPGRRCVQRAVAGDAARRRGSSRRSVHTPARGGPQGR